MLAMIPAARQDPGTRQALASTQAPALSSRPSPRRSAGLLPRRPVGTQQTASAARDQGIFTRIGIGKEAVRLGMGARSGGVNPVTSSSMRTDLPVSKH